MFWLHNLASPYPLPPPYPLLHPVALHRYHDTRNMHIEHGKHHVTWQNTQLGIKQLAPPTTLSILSSFHTVQVYYVHSDGGCLLQCTQMLAVLLQSSANDSSALQLTVTHLPLQEMSAVHSVHYPLPHYRSQQGAGRRGSIRQQWTFVFLQ